MCRTTERVGNCGRAWISVPTLKMGALMHGKVEIRVTYPKACNNLSLTKEEVLTHYS